MTGSDGTLLMGFIDKSRVDKLVSVLKNSEEKYDDDTLLKFKYRSAFKFQKAFSWIPSLIGLLANVRYSKI